MKIIEKIKEEIKYYWKDFWRAALKSNFKYELKVKNNFKKNSTQEKTTKRIMEFLEAEKRQDEKVSPKRRTLNNAFYATIGQVIVAVIFGLPLPFQTGSIFYLFFAVDAMFYILLGLMVSKGRKWAGIILFVWFCLDKLLPGIIHLFTHFSFLGLFYFTLFNYFFGQFYYKAFRYFRKNQRIVKKDKF